EHEERHQAVVEEDVAPEPHRLVRPAHEDEEREVAVEEIAGQAEEDRAEQPGERTAAHGAELSPADEQGLPHEARRSSRPTRVRKASSSEVSTGTSASRPQPRSSTRAASAARTSRAGSSSTRQRAWPSVAGSGSTA